MFTSRLGQYDDTLLHAASRWLDEKLRRRPKAANTNAAPARATVLRDLQAHVALRLSSLAHAREGYRHQLKKRPTIIPHDLRRLENHVVLVCSVYRRKR